MHALLALSRGIDRLNDRLGMLANALVLLCCGISTGNAAIRYAFGAGSNVWLEAQWYLFAAIVMFGAATTFRRNEHVRVEIFYTCLSERGRLWLDLVGTLVFLIPVCLLLAALSWPFFHQSFAVWEVSPNPGGLPRWPIRFLLPMGFTLLALQGVSEVIKRIAALLGQGIAPTSYERAPQ